MKRFFIIIAIIIGIYFALAGVLTTTGICPKSIDWMPSVVGDGFVSQDINSKIWQQIFCPFAKDVY